MKHVVMYSGGLGSWMTACRVSERHGSDNTVLLFADVGGTHSSPHVGEDADTYRFIEETAPDLGTLVTLNEGRDIWEVFKDDHFLGNSRLANCSKYLKQKPCREWLDVNCDPADTTVYVGIDWSESHRLPAIRHNYLPYLAEAPLCEPPFVDRNDMLRACREAGVAPPRLYALGASHNNCAGACVRGGQAHWKWLLEVRPDTYRYAEAREQELREHLDADVSILRDRSGGKSTPLTLRAFRQRVESQPSLFDPHDVGGCGCFTEPTTLEDAGGRK